jgi:hypothetical protein
MRSHLSSGSLCVLVLKPLLKRDLDVFSLIFRGDYFASLIFSQKSINLFSVNLVILVERRTSGRENFNHSR